MVSSFISTSTANKLGGMDVKFIVEDEQGKPDTAVTKAKKLDRCRTMCICSSAACSPPPAMPWHR